MENEKHDNQNFRLVSWHLSWSPGVYCILGKCILPPGENQPSNKLVANSGSMFMVISPLSPTVY